MPTDQQKNYQCLHCGCKEFITQPNRYDIYVAEEGKVRFSHSEIIDNAIELYCRDCSEILSCSVDDIEM
ncbi:MAG: hypothetical protein EAZ95_00755 [Bacteroidetes bacterium]|nr:MAG: hypothetical protein EAZ95_00755 [Bacteroidota bacterium]